MDLELEASFDAADDALDDCDTMELASVVKARRSAARWRLTGAGGVEGQSGVRVVMYRGSVKGRQANKQRDFAMGVYNIKRDYFDVDGNPPVYDEYDFERRFRVSWSGFLSIYDTVKNEPGRKQSGNATG
eukprot:contig_6715_g1544